MLTDEIKGKPLVDVARLNERNVLDALGVEVSPARLKCALLSLDTLRLALAARVASQAKPDEGA
jgi:nitrogen fixation NifU-like protein